MQHFLFGGEAIEPRERRVGTDLSAIDRGAVDPHDGVFEQRAEFRFRLFKLLLALACLGHIRECTNRAAIGQRDRADIENTAVRALALVGLVFFHHAAIADELDKFVALACEFAGFHLVFDQFPERHIAPDEALRQVEQLGHAGVEIFDAPVSADLHHALRDVLDRLLEQTARLLHCALALHDVGDVREHPHLATLRQDAGLHAQDGAIAACAIEDAVLRNMSLGGGPFAEFGLHAGELALGDHPVDQGAEQRTPLAFLMRQAENSTKRVL